MASTTAYITIEGTNSKLTAKDVEEIIRRGLIEQSRNWKSVNVVITD